MDESKIEKLKELELEMVGTYNFKELTTKIAEFMYHYTLKTHYHYTRQTPKTLGNVSYWLEEKNGQIILMYNVHPKDWNMNRIAYEFELDEKKFYEHVWGGAHKNYDQY